MPLPRSIAKTLLYVIFLMVVTSAGLELALRVVMDGKLWLAPLENDFWRPDDQLGWDLVSNFSGEFDKGLFKGRVNVNTDGIRLNATEDTFVSAWPSVFFIGDSATASLEVDDALTVPALLEQDFRSRGLSYNIINLGVRGYATDQSVLKAIRLSKKIPTQHIIYLYDNNDEFDNNTLRLPFKAYGKGVFLRPDGATDFQPYKFGEVYPDKEAGVILFDETCHPVVHRFELSQHKIVLARVARWMQGLNSYLYNGFILPEIRRVYRGKQDESITPWADIDPLAHLSAIPSDWVPNLETAYRDEGVLRRRCAEYFTAQMRFLMQRLRESTGAATVHVVAFPHLQTLERLDHGFDSPSAGMFAELVEDATIDSFLDLTEALYQDNRAYTHFACPQDYHFCETGNRWITGKLLESLSLR